MRVEARGPSRRPRGGGSPPSRGGAVIACVLLVLAAACAPRRPPARSFAAAGEEQRSSALAAWRRAAERADSLGPSRLLYSARVKQGIASITGTLAVETGSPVHAVLTGPFGAALATYTDGALRGEKLVPVFIEPEALVSLLAGVWKAPSPEVRGVDGDDALLAWSSTSPAGLAVEGVLNVPGARFVRLRVERGGKAIDAVYSGAAGATGSTGAPDPWPSRIELTDVSSGSTLRLVLEGHEAMRRDRTGENAR